ncbi:RepB family DNA primase [Burkholderia vietnamiensis]|nr:DNA-primase RepB domain-containing protein [Burkholderia vietnamiensis]MCA8292058.1 RepB family DNA primase [Burkholderia vietnamiensis]
MNAPAYRITLIGRGEHDGRNWNIGKGKGDEPEKFHTADEVRNMIPTLARHNARGFDVYLTPIDKAHHYVLIDDTTPAKLDRMKADGYEPTLVQQSSANNLQAVLKIDRQDRKDEQSLANNVVQNLNQTYGDPHLSGVIHPFRMAGFSNKKAGRGDAFTKVLESQGGHVDPKATQVLDERREAVEQARIAAAVKVREQRLDKAQIQSMNLPQWDKNAAKIYADQVQEQKGLAAKQGWALDWSVVDYRASQRLLTLGADAAVVGRTVQEFSPGLADRKHNPADYAARTVQKALDGLSPAQQQQRATNQQAIAQKMEQQRQQEAEAAREREAEAQQQRQRRMSMGRSR